MIKDKYELTVYYAPDEFIAAKSLMDDLLLKQVVEDALEALLLEAGDRAELVDVLVAPLSWWRRVQWLLGLTVARAVTLRFELTHKEV